MNYMSGQRILCGDKILFDSVPAIVVFVVSDNAYLPEYKDGVWEKLVSGIGILTDDGELITMPSAENEIVFVSRCVAAH